MKNSPAEINAIAAAVANVFRPLIVACGVGVDSVAMLKGLHDRGEVPALILFAHTGDEKPETIEYLHNVLNPWLRSIGFPIVTEVKNPRPKSGDKSLSESCLRNSVLPALAYKQHQCSIVWKIDPQEAFIAAWIAAFGDAIVRPIVCVGYDAGAADGRRCERAGQMSIAGCDNRYPLIEWGWTRERCIAEIEAAGLPVPMKSACYFCPSSKPVEIVWLKTTHRDLFDRCVEMERKAHQRGLVTIAGLANMGNETFAQYDDGKADLGAAFLAQFKVWKKLHAAHKRQLKAGNESKAAAIAAEIEERRAAFEAARNALYNI